jgi:hypothetical protein
MNDFKLLNEFHISNDGFINKNRMIQLCNLLQTFVNIEILFLSCSKELSNDHFDLIFHFFNLLEFLRLHEFKLFADGLLELDSFGMNARETVSELQIFNVVRLVIFGVGKID